MLKNPNILLCVSIQAQCYRQIKINLGEQLNGSRVQHLKSENESIYIGVKVQKC